MKYTLLHEVMEAMNKQQPDAEAVDMASNVLKLRKAQEMLGTSIHSKTRLVSMRVIARARTNGAFGVYERILERRNNVKRT